MARFRAEEIAKVCGLTGLSDLSVPITEKFFDDIECCLSDWEMLARKFEVDTSNYSERDSTKTKKIQFLKDWQQESVSATYEALVVGLCEGRKNNDATKICKMFKRINPTSPQTTTTATESGLKESLPNIPPAVNVPTSSISDVTVPKKFSKDFKAIDFAKWMKDNYDLPEPDCELVIEKRITGRVFPRLNAAAIQEYGFKESGLYIMQDVLEEVQKELKTDSASEPIPAVLQQQPPPNISSENEPSTSASSSRTVLESHHYGDICGQLVRCEEGWEDIARNLNFHDYEITKIRNDISARLQSRQLYSVIEFWLRWAPNDGRGSTDVATLEALQSALNRANFAKVKLKLSN